MRQKTRFKPGVTSRIALAAFLLPVGIAKADWGFTHWGMTPEQVVAASGGTAKLLPEKERTRNDADHWVMSATGTYRDGDLTYQTGFTFDTGNGGLTCVFYNTTGDDVQKLTDKLMAKLGKPDSDGDFASMRDIKWSHGDDIELVALQQPHNAAVTHCVHGK